MESNKILLDTHILLWWLSNPTKIKKTARNLISDANSDIFLSSASIWELSIKASRGKFSMPGNLLEQLISERIEVLPINGTHALRSGTLPMVHYDPFDRIMISQAICEDMFFVSRDRAINGYDIKLIEG